VNVGREVLVTATYPAKLAGQLAVRST